MGLFCGTFTVCSVTSNMCFISCSSVTECRMLACSFMLLCSVFFFECLSRSTCCSRHLVFLSSISHLRRDVKQQFTWLGNADSFYYEKPFIASCCMPLWRLYPTGRRVGGARACVCLFVCWLVTQCRVASWHKSKCLRGAEPGLDLQVDSQRWEKPSMNWRSRKSTAAGQQQEKPFPTVADFLGRGPL